MRQNKERILELLSLLWTQTDEKHPVTTTQIMAMFSEKGHTLNRKTVSADIKTLEEAGFQISVTGGRENGYYLENRLFADPELRMLIDAVSSAPFLTKAKSHELVGKLLQMTSMYKAGDLSRHLYCADALRPMSEKVYETLDVINRAINGRARISFQYFDYGPKKRKRLRHRGKVYEESPCFLVFSNSRYYLVCWSDEHQDMVQFRVDRMTGAEVVLKEAAAPPQGFSIDEYVRSMYGMFGSSRSLRHVQLLCENDRMNNILDQFGFAVRTSVVDDQHFLADVEVAVSPNLFAEVFRYNGGIKIQGPEDVVSSYRDWLSRALAQYENHNDGE